ncbi:MAG: putative toxin-antitoxin system toxin component, PIN family [Chlamydiae bacterium]|nr:putative toxin-antitoxin system toxin component, PIN family [Chlamydiota bacterium]MBI3276651.1 putative toxin-antitoxin system toxin component, PIN family [Chlamydiota bacterium]
MYRIVIDTNVIVSAHLTRLGFPRMAFKSVLRGNVELYVTEAILDEYETVLRKPKLKFSSSDIQAIISSIKKHAKLIKPQRLKDDGIKDLTDKKFLECAVAAEADFIVTGDKKAFEFKQYENIKLVNATQFLGELGLAHFSKFSND